MRGLSDVSPGGPGQWFRETAPGNASEDATDGFSDQIPLSNLDKLIESIVEEDDYSETPADSDGWILRSLRHLNELCQNRRNSLVTVEKHLEQARAGFERATIAADVARREYEASERGVDEGRLRLAQSVGRILGREKREEMQRKVDELVDDVQRSPNADSNGAMGFHGHSAEESTPTSAGSSLGSIPRSRPSIAPMETPLLHAKSRQGMPTPSSMPRVTDAGMPSTQSLSRRRSGWHLHRDFLQSSTSQLS